MLRKDFEQDCKDYEALVKEFDEIEKVSDNDADLDPVREKMRVVEERIDAKGRNYGNAITEYMEAKARGNEYIDIDDCIWDKDVPAVIENLRSLGIDHFTYSSTWTGAVQTAWLFVENGCTLEGITQINDRDPEDKKAAYIFAVN